MLNVCADWLVKLQISCAIYLRATREKMASRFVSVTSEEIIQNNFSWCILSHRLSSPFIFISPLCGSVNIHTSSMGGIFLIRTLWKTNWTSYISYISLRCIPPPPPPPPGIFNPSVWGIWIFSLSVIEQ